MIETTVVKVIEPQKLRTYYQAICTDSACSFSGRDGTFSRGTEAYAETYATIHARDYGHAVQIERVTEERA